jgi:hypothetical protein
MLNVSELTRGAGGRAATGLCLGRRPTARPAMHRNGPGFQRTYGVLAVAASPASGRYP